MNTWIYSWSYLALCFCVCTVCFYIYVGSHTDAIKISLFHRNRRIIYGSSTTHGWRVVGLAAHPTFLTEDPFAVGRHVFEWIGITRVDGGQSLNIRPRKKMMIFDDSIKLNLSWHSALPTPIKHTMSSGVSIFVPLSYTLLDGEHTSPTNLWKGWLTGSARLALPGSSAWLGKALDDARYSGVW